MLRILTLILLFIGTSLFGQVDGKLSKEEKSEISAHLQYSWDNLEQLVSRMTQEQWNYKSIDTVWSIAEISEHLEKSEMQLFSLVKDQLQTSPAEPEKAGEAKGKTQVVMDAITSRDHKLKTTPELEPTGSYHSSQQFLKSFAKLRVESITYAQTTEDALRHHFIPFGPLGELDGYQILMFMSGHLERHIQQIEEVMQDPSFPST